MKEELIVSRIARLHYGMSLEIPCDDRSEKRRMGLECVWDDAEKRHFVKGRMEWIVKRVSLALILGNGRSDVMRRVQELDSFELRVTRASDTFDIPQSLHMENWTSTSGYAAIRKRLYG